MTDSTEATGTHPFGAAMSDPTVAATLHLVFPRELATTVSLDPNPKVLGRGRDGTTFRIDHQSVSRRHLAVAWDPTLQTHCVTELGSRNGSRVNGTRIVSGADPVPLTPGSIVRLGSVVLVYEIGAMPVSEELHASREAVPGESLCMRELRNVIGIAAPDPAAVLLQGETGTGKEYMARELHRLSGRSGQWVAINCAALSPALVESQLFGHRKGAFTGADTAQSGLLQAADGGTLFLDEVGELPAHVQPKLLRVLQEGTVRPVGETRTVRVDVRIISATLRDLPALAHSGDFRLDLYARLAPIEIRVPALRERRADILSWLERLHELWHRSRNRIQHDPPEFGPDAVERLLLLLWPENLRGLERLVQYHCSRKLRTYDAPGSLTGTAAPFDTHSATPVAPRKNARRPRPTKEELVKSLDTAGWSVRAVAKQLGRERRQIYRWMERYNLREK